MSTVDRTKYSDITLLQETDAGEIIPGEEGVAQPLDINYKDYKKPSAKAANIISLSCSPDVNPHSDLLYHSPNNLIPPLILVA